MYSCVCGSMCFMNVHNSIVLGTDTRSTVKQSRVWSNKHKHVLITLGMKRIVHIDWLICEFIAKKHVIVIKKWHDKRRNVGLNVRQGLQLSLGGRTNWKLNMVRSCTHDWRGSIEVRHRKPDDITLPEHGHSNDTWRWQAIVSHPWKRQGCLVQWLLLLSRKRLHSPLYGIIK